MPTTRGRPPGLKKRTVYVRLLPDDAALLLGYAEREQRSIVNMATVLLLEALHVRAVRETLAREAVDGLQQETIP